MGHGSQRERHLHRHHQSGNGPRLREHHADISRIHQDRKNRRCQPRHPQWYLNKYLGLYVQNDLLLRRVHLTLQIYEFIFYYQYFADKNSVYSCFQSCYNMNLCEPDAYHIVSYSLIIKYLATSDLLFVRVSHQFVELSRRDYYG